MYTRESRRKTMLWLVPGYLSGVIAITTTQCLAKRCNLSAAGRSIKSRPNTAHMLCTEGKLNLKKTLLAVMKVRKTKTSRASSVCSLLCQFCAALPAKTCNFRPPITSFHGDSMSGSCRNCDSSCDGSRKGPH